MPDAGDTLKSGQMLGQYRIADKIGEGGMGEVYSARDTRLDRDVAVKILPPEFAGDAQRLARFEREAKAVAALSYPNIMAIHDFGREGSIAYAVAELLDGQSLRQVLGGGALPPRKAVEYARQIANGLAAAHERGVIHRDLKPENLFIGRDGRVKILDFGLARIVEPDDTAAVTTEAPTAAVQTTPGTVMGSAGYMSPEQVRGRQVDSRSDLFSLGSILYEMLTGQRAFAGDSPVETMSAILKEDPPELTTAGGTLPAGVGRIVLHCLEKNADERFQSARDLAFQLSSLGSMSVSGSQPEAALVAGSGVRRRRPLLWPLAALVLGLAIGVAAMWSMASRPAAQAGSFTPLTFRNGRIQDARFTADGQTVIYAAAWNGQPLQLYAVQVGVPGSRPLDLGTAALLGVSSKGDLAIGREQHFTVGWETSGTLARAPLQGGGARDLLENVHEADWSPDGETLAVVRHAAGRYLLEYPMGTVLYETAGWISGMRVSPDGRHIAFLDHPVRGDNIGRLVVVDMKGHATDLGPLGAHGLAWSPDGREIWVKNGPNIRGVTPAGEVRLIQITDGYSRLIDVHASGQVLMINGNVRREVAARRAGSEEVNLSWFNWTALRGITDDGRRVLFQEEGLGTPEYLLYLASTEGGTPVQLGQGAAYALSPDGQWALAFRDLFTNPRPELLPTGAGQPVPLDWGGLRPALWGEWMPDGSGVLIAGRLPGGTQRVYLAGLDGEALRPIAPEGVGSDLPYNTISPDGAWLAAATPGLGTRLYPLAGGEPRQVPGLAAEEMPLRWSENGRRLYVFAIDTMPANVYSVDVESGDRELLHTLQPTDSAGVINIDLIMLTPDGASYAYSYRRMLSRLYSLSNLE